jgi:hypothetical protein
MVYLSLFRTGQSRRRDDSSYTNRLPIKGEDCIRVLKQGK